MPNRNNPTDPLSISSRRISASACFSLMLGFEQNLSLEFEAAHVTDSGVSWIAVNSNKPKRADDFTLMVHSSKEYAEAHIDDDREKVIQHLMGQTSRIIGYDVSPADYKTVHGWRYANNDKRDQTRTILLDQEHKLAACGDWCLGGRIEGAFTSAYNLALKLKESIL